MKFWAVEFDSKIREVCLLRQPSNKPSTCTITGEVSVNSRYHYIKGSVRLRVVPLLLSPSCVTREKTKRDKKMAAQNLGSKEHSSPPRFWHAHFFSRFPFASGTMDKAKKGLLTGSVTVLLVSDSLFPVLVHIRFAVLTDFHMYCSLSRYNGRLNTRWVAGNLSIEKNFWKMFSHTPLGPGNRSCDPKWAAWRGH